MSAHLGVTTLYGITSPSGCVVNESSKESNQPVKTYLLQNGNTGGADQLKLITTKITLKGKGIPALSIVAAQASMTTGTPYVTSLDIEESDDARPDFTIEAVQYANAA